jgi:hypothetical protein
MLFRQRVRLQPAQKTGENEKPVDLLVNIIFLVSRYLHIVCSTLIVGGTLFFEMVVPIAIADLKPEQQLAIFARARWVFRQIVWSSAAVLLISGGITTARQWKFYSHAEGPVIGVTAEGVMQTANPSPMQRSDWWWIAHVSTGCMAVFIALSLTIGSSPPTYPVQWMRLNLIILMIVIFLGSTTRHVRQNVMEQEADLADRRLAATSALRIPLLESTEPTTQPSTAEANQP